MTVRKGFSLLFLVMSGLGCLAAKEEEAPENPSLTIATQILQNTGLPLFPEKATEVQCYAWNGQSAGIYSTFILKEPDLAAYLESLPTGLARNSPIPRNLLAPPNSAAPWFTPGAISDGVVYSRGRLANAAPEMFRLYVDPENSRLFLYYTWNNKWTYP